MPESPAESRSLLDFVLWNARVLAPFGSVQSPSDGYTLKTRSVANYNLIYITRGRVVWVVDKVDYPLAAGDMILVPPRTEHHAFSRTMKVTLGSLHVRVSLPGGQDALKLLAPPRVRRVTSASRFDQLWRAYMGEFEPSRIALSRTMMQGWGALLALELLRFDAQAGHLVEQPVDPLVSKVLDELHRHASGELSLSSLGAWSGFSAQHLNRVFRRELGVTPLQYHMRLRLERAADLLVEGRLTIRAVAGELGFEDPYYFSRTFRRHFGQSPSEFRDNSGSKSPFDDSSHPFHVEPENR